MPDERCGRGVGYRRSTRVTTYKLTLVNQSETAWCLFAYQAPQQQASGFLCPVWLCSPFMAAPNVNCTFEWTTDYIFVWGDVGIIEPGVVFSANETLPADLQTANSTNFSMDPEPHFSPSGKGSPPGSLMISVGSAVPGNTFSIGIGMGDSSTLVLPAVSNRNYTITPAPALWIAAGTNVQVGTILDTSAVKQNSQVTFPPNEVTCTLDKNNKWSQASSS
jgi:rhizosphere induced protein